MYKCLFAFVATQTLQLMAMSDAEAMQSSAASAINHFQTRGEDAKKFLTETYASNSKDKTKVVFLLGKLAYLKDWAEPLLIQALDDKSTNVRFHSIRALAELKTESTLALLRIATLTSDDKEIVRDASKQALKELLPGPDIQVEIPNRIKAKQHILFDFTLSRDPLGQKNISFDCAEKIYDGVYKGFSAIPESKPIDFADRKWICSFNRAGQYKISIWAYCKSGPIIRKSEKQIIINVEED